MSTELSAPPTGTFKGEPFDAAPLTLPADLVATIDSLSQEGRIGARLHAPPNGAPLGAGVSAWLFPRFAIFDAESSEGCAQLGAVPYADRALLVGYMSDVLHFFDPRVGPDGTRIGSMEMLCMHLYGVQVRTFAFSLPSSLLGLFLYWSSVSTPLPSPRPKINSNHLSLAVLYHPRACCR